jgi:predicted enzyme related to lactoylglutathione lyase
MRALSLMVIQYVHDMSRAVAFYRNAMGLQVISESPGWSMLSCGDALVGLHVIESGVGEGLAPHAGLSLEVQNLEIAIADIRKAGGNLREIREPDLPHVPVRLAVVEDSEGNVFEIGHMVDSEGRYASVNH